MVFHAGEELSDRTPAGTASDVMMEIRAATAPAAAAVRRARVVMARCPFDQER
jgi:hypothetical protein